MNLTEDQLKAALAATGREFPPHRVPALRLPADHRAPGRPRGALTDRRWLAAVAAVIAVFGVIAASMLLANGLRPERPSNPLAQLPAYYVALQQAPGCQCDLTPPDSWITNPDRALVRSRSGQTLAIVTPPRPYGTFAAVRAAADDRTFVLAAQRAAYISAGYPATKFYLLRINPSAAPGQRAVLTPLPVPVVPAGTAPYGVALSPDGTRLAELTCPEMGTCKTRLHVYDLHSGTSRTWTVALANRAGLVISSVALEWAADNRTLAIALQRSGTAVGLLDTTAPGLTFAADARILQLQHVTRGLGRKPPPEVVLGGMLTPDGRHVLESVGELRILDRDALNPAAYSVRELSLATGKTRLVLRDTDLDALLWSSPAGTALLAFSRVADTGSVALESSLPAHAVLNYPQGTARVAIPPGTLAMAW